MRMPMREALKRYLVLLVAWLPFFVIWVLLAMTYGRISLGSAVVVSLISMGSATLLGAAVWNIARRWPWPINLTVRFYLLHAGFSVLYSTLWVLSTFFFESLRRGTSMWNDLRNTPALAWEFLMGIWLYELFAGVSYAVQTRQRLHEKETHALRAESLAAAARLDAIRARLNPHFLFNALHTLSALVKFRPESAERAIERLGDMLRYALKEDGRELVEFSEEYDFARRYLAFEQLRYEDRLKVNLEIDPESHNFDVLPFSIQTLAENAVRHAISIRPEGGSIWIRTTCKDGRMTITVKDDGPGNGHHANPSHQFGLRALQERLHAAFGENAELQTQSSPDGFEARFAVPLTPDGHSREQSTKVATHE
jgi:two-component system, LytTR family, sensor kinase